MKTLFVAIVVLVSFLASAQQPSLPVPVVPDRTVQWCPFFSPGWNLVGNPTSTKLYVKATFTPLSNGIVSVWKWGGPQNEKWYFYTPRMTTDAMQKYAINKGLGIVDSINPGEGFWVLATDYISLPCVNVQADSTLEFNLSFGEIHEGWSLVAPSSDMQVSEIAGLANQAPPSPGGGTTSALNPRIQIVSIWGWNADKGEWYFNSPMLSTIYGPAEAARYTEEKGYRQFPDRFYPIGTGLWMNIIPNTGGCVLICGGKG